ncbi:hypothetical protein BST85_05055 [Aureitalea marina]|uniref:Uncharacterized protein n=2 Tax=Aureitalea marina TaxID=930804 RepID=A0A2S7KNY3_9FLAO|nr:hypothetical protein BST85_05055 [Aureitalea marina]
MTKKDFFRIVIKIFGLYALLLSVLTYLPSSLSFILPDIGATEILLIAGILVLILLLYVFLIRKTDMIINLLQLDKGYDDDTIVLGNFDSLKIVKFALIIIGGMMLLDYVPDFLRYSFLAFKSEVSANGLDEFERMSYGSSIDYFNWALSGVNIVIGYLMLSNYSKIGKWLTRDDKTLGNNA